MSKIAATRTKKPTSKERDEIVAKAETPSIQDSDIPLTHKYRPRLLSDVVGQVQAVEVIEDAFLSNRVPRSWLLEGPTGTGKTTLARFISQRANCLKPQGPNPCGKCTSCEKYLTQPAPTHPAHHEINASDDRGIDAVRELIQLSRVNPMVGNMRVLMLDEPQGLTPAAQEALLKALEDPPKTAMWILPTTDPGKLKNTIIGRCRAGHLRIRPPTAEELGKRLYQITKLEGIAQPIDKKWFLKIATASNYQCRDAIAVLEQIHNAIRGRRNVKIEDVLPKIVDAVQSGSPDRVAMDVLGSSWGGDLKAAHEAVRTCGTDPHVIIGCMLRIVEQIMLGLASKTLVEPYYNRTMYRVFKERGLDADSLNIDAVARVGEFLARQYERAKTFIVPGSYTMTLVITGMYSIMVTPEEGDAD